MAKKIGILITSRNNYAFMEDQWIKHIKQIDDYNQFDIINIDEDSTEEQKKLGRELCKKNNIIYMDREERGMHHNILTAANYLEPKGVEYIVWFQHDAWPLQKDFFSSFNDLVSTGKLAPFGTVGFNGLGENILEQHNYHRMVEEMHNNEIPIGVLARSPLERGDQWYCGVKSRRIKSPILCHEKYKKPFSVESLAWFAASINISKFRQFINVNHPFYWFRCWDDICFQFLKNNIHNLVLPSYYVAHRPDLKTGSNVPKRSVRLAYKGKDDFHSLVGFTDKEWKKVWGFFYDKRASFGKVESKYKKTLLYEFYNHNMHEGPLKTFDI